MFSNPPILDDFIYPIPYCHSKTNLNSILNIFHRWNCQQIAIFQQNSKWGLIDSVDLLSLITEVHLNQKTVASGRFRSSMPQQAVFSLNDLNLIVKPAVVYQSDLRLDEFLNGLGKGSLSSDRQKYLIVNRLGELQGKLDKNKILEYLASEYKLNRGDSQPLAPSNYWLELLDSVALPLKIETTSGKNLYSNVCWQELIIGDRSWQHQLHPERAIASWWLEQQAKILARDNPKKAQSRQELKYSNGDRSSILSSSSSLDLEIEANSTNKNQQPSSSSPQFKIDQHQDWNYIKIPLTDDREYQLILAISTGSPSSLPKSVINKLLATVSHELKSPLTGIVGLSNLLEAEKLGRLNQRQTRYVELIRSSGQKMMDIVNDLIKLTTITEESSSLSESIDLELLCRQVYQQLWNQLQSSDTRDIQMSNSDELELDIEENTIAIASKSYLSCILYHLMMEAIEFARSPEQLKIEINSLSGSIAITISSITTVLPSEPDYNICSSLRLAIVEYLTEFIQGNFKSDRQGDRRQFTLLLPTRAGQISSQPATAITANETAKPNLTILCLYPEAEAVSSRADDCNSINFGLKSFLDSSKYSSNYRHRIIEANGLEQAHILARIWQLDAIVLEGDRLTNPFKYLGQLQTSEYLSAVPLITLDNETTQAANQIKGLSVYPCLLPAKHRRIEDLMQVIQIAVRSAIVEY